MLATGNSASAALSRLKEASVTSLKFRMPAGRPGRHRHTEPAHPDVPITTSAVDSHLNDHGIVPGLGVRRPASSGPDERQRGRVGRIRQQHEGEILQAAEHVFARRGFQGATMAEIALRAGMPKSNLRYYFGTKVGAAPCWPHPRPVAGRDRPLHPEAGRPREYPQPLHRGQDAPHRRAPDASRVFANELLHGARRSAIICGALRALVADKAAVIRGWIADGRLEPVDPEHLFFSLWALTQTYAASRPRSAPCWGGAI